jgi:hypothetical protein
MDILAALKVEESKLQQQLKAVREAMKVLSGGTAGIGKRGNRKRVVSPATKAKMAKAQRERWAKRRAENKGKKAA